jgi:hypothetical protein
MPDGLSPGGAHVVFLKEGHGRCKFEAWQANTFLFVYTCFRRDYQPMAKSDIRALIELNIAYVCH